ncbi:MAG: imidazole glycerol phosphate synthase subunit HisH [Phycisphaerae bacterium]
MSVIDGSPTVVIVDHGAGNLSSVRFACEAVGLRATISASASALPSADAVILPGVGAFGRAMAALEERGLVEPLRAFAAGGRPLWGICLGMQLLMEESEEFGRHRGLGLVPGRVVGFARRGDGSHPAKVPHIGWNRIVAPGSAPSAWAGTPLAGLPDGTCMYFVHSFCVKPAVSATTLSVTEYAGVRFCSSLQQGSIFGCQFHPERSGRAGLAVYRRLASLLGVSGLDREDRRVVECAVR